MLGRSSKKQKPQETTASEPFTYIHRGTTLVGDLEASGRVRVHGTVHGNVRVTGILEVAEAGTIEGDRVEADEVKILGKVRANVDAKGKIEIWKDGLLEGDVRASALDIEEGASFTGRSEMTGSGRAAPRLPESASGGQRPSLRQEMPATLGSDPDSDADGDAEADAAASVEPVPEEAERAGS